MKLATPFLVLFLLLVAVAVYVLGYCDARDHAPAPCTTIEEQIQPPTGLKATVD